MTELTWRERGRLWLRLGLRLALLALLVLLIWKVGLPLLGFLMPFVLGLLAAWAFNRPIRFLQRRLGIPRGVLSVIFLVVAFAVVGGVLFGFIYAIVSQLQSFFQNWEGLWGSAQGILDAIVDAVEEWISPLPQDIYSQLASLLDTLTQWLERVIPDLLSGVASRAGSMAMSIPSFVVSLVFFVMAAYFISADYPHLRFVATSQVPNEMRGFLSKVKTLAVGAFGGYVKAQLILSFFVFWILLAGFLILRQPYALLLAIALAIMDFIPIIGSGTVMIPWAVIDVFLRDFRHAVALMVIWGIIALFRRVAEPKVVGDQTGLSPILSLLSLYVGMKLGGVIGMILGPVVCMVIVNLAKGGFFENTVADLRLAALDISALRKPQNTPAAAPPPEEEAPATEGPEEQTPQ